MADDDRAAEVDAYLADLAPETRSALQELRAVIRAAAPTATQRVSYGVAVFRHHGSLVGFGAGPNHLSMYTMSPSLVKAWKRDLRPYRVSGATIHFSAAEPLPDALVRRVVKARMVENESRARRSPRAR